MRALTLLAAAALVAGATSAQLAVRAKRAWTLAGAPIDNAVVLVENGKIRAVGPAASTPIPAGWQTLDAAVTTPGLIDARTTAGLTGILNTRHDQEQLDPSAAMQPELRAIDAYDAREPLLEHLRSLGTTTIHAGHAPLALISGQTLVAKLRGTTIDQAVLVPAAMVSCTLGDASTGVAPGKTPGTRSKAVALLRQELVKARELRDKRASVEPGKAPDRDLHLEALVDVLDRKLPLLVCAQRARDIDTALRLREEFGFELVLEGAAEAYLRIEELKAARVPILLHATMSRPGGELENLSMVTAAELRKAGLAFAIQTGHEGYVPKVRVPLFEAAIACKQGLAFEDALRAVTLDAARILKLDTRIGSLEVGKDADLALWDGDPFEYATHCVATIVDGAVLFRGAK
jgi:imidazolonepropionase-like amidohydrolase